MISNHSAFKMVLDDIEDENKNQHFNKNSVESSVQNFTIKLIKKWISEYSPTKDEYKLKMKMLLKEGKKPTKITNKEVDAFFLSDVTASKFLDDPLTVLSFDHRVLVPSMKSIEYFIGLTKNLINYEEHNTKTFNNKFDGLSTQQRERGSGSQLEEKNINISKTILEILNRIKASLSYQNHADAYINFMTLQCLYLVMKQTERLIPGHNSTVRELINLIVINASLDMHGSILFGFNQLVQHLQINDRVSEANLFTDLFFGYQSCNSSFSISFNPSKHATKFVPNILRIYNDFEARNIKQMHANLKIQNEAKSFVVEVGNNQFVIPKAALSLQSKLDKIMSINSHEYFEKREKSMNSKELCNYFEIYIMYVKNCLIRNTTYKKRTNLDAVLSSIIKI